MGNMKQALVCACVCVCVRAGGFVPCNFDAGKNWVKRPKTALADLKITRRARSTWLSKLCSAKECHFATMETKIQIFVGRT